MLLFKKFVISAVGGYCACAPQAPNKPSYTPAGHFYRLELGQTSLHFSFGILGRLSEVREHINMACYLTLYRYNVPPDDTLTLAKN
jgi:hypothetical protein